MENEDRGFKEVDVNNFSAQSRKDRYPDPDNQYSRTDQFHVSSVDIELQDDNEAEDEPPRIAPWRMNLTALSQCLNIYFVACQVKIHCYIPRDLKQTLSTKAGLILDLPRSDEGKQVTGYISPRVPHCVNNMMTGNLGKLEILLMACDDGDVIAYYTHQIWHELRPIGGHTPGTIGTVKPFFHQNVRKSGWALVIHEHARLIAVSSNNKEITVFAPALIDEESYSEKTSKPTNNIRRGFSDDDLQKNLALLDLADNSTNEEYPLNTVIDPSISSFEPQNRHRSFRFLYTFEDDGHNIKTIDFIPAARDWGWGILAGDTAGGVLALPLEWFKEVETPHEGLGCDSALPGMSLSKSRREHFFDISYSISELKDSSKRYIGGSGTTGSDRSVIYEDEEVLQLISDEDGDYEYVPGPYEYPRATERGLQRAKVRLEETDVFRVFTGVFPPVKLAAASFSMAEQIVDSQRSSVYATQKKLSNLDEDPQPSYAVLRCFSADIELSYDHSRPGFSTLLSRPALQAMPDHLIHLYRFARNNMLVRIPELNLIIVGSQIGRVMLLTLTKFEPFSRHQPVPMFRLDVILPFKRHEEKNRPQCPLLGVAVSPVQTRDSYIVKSHQTRDAGDEANGSHTSGGTPGANRSWRMILHYYDHTVLSYDIYRKSENEPLDIF